MATDPQGFFRFANRHYPLLHDIFYRSDGLTEADLRDLIESRRDNGDPAAVKVIDQLRSLDILEPVPDASATFELTAPVRGLLSFLLRKHRLTSAKVIQGYLADLEELHNELDNAVRQNLGNRAERVLADISQLLERIRQDSRANREAIIGEVLKIKSNSERRSTRERFEIINRLWSRYLDPLRDLIDVKKEMDSSLDNLDLGLIVGGKSFVLEGALAREFFRCRARLLRLRRGVADDFRESIREMEPLYVSLKRESELVRGASFALEILDRSGVDCLALDELMAIPGWRFMGAFSDSSLDSFLHEIHGYKPTLPAPLPEFEEVSIKEFILPSEMFSRLEAALPIDDLLAWLITEYPDVEMSELVRAYGWIFLGKVGEMSSAKEECRYSLPEATLITRPLRVENHNERE